LKFGDDVAKQVLEAILEANIHEVMGIELNSDCVADELNKDLISP